MTTTKTTIWLNTERRDRKREGKKLHFFTDYLVLNEPGNEQPKTNYFNMHMRRG
jgi:hypothetical protein